MKNVKFPKMMFTSRPFFDEGPENVSLSKSIRISMAAWQALRQLAQEYGLTTNNYLVVALDLHLQEKVRSKEIEKPKKWKAK